MPQSSQSTQPILWQDDALVLLDQRRLPHIVEFIRCDTAAQVVDAIRNMVVRGAPAIGIAAAYGVALSARARIAEDATGWQQRVLDDIALLRQSRPTAVNLMWALERMAEVLAQSSAQPFARLLAAASQLHADDLAANQAMGAAGATLLGPGTSVLTHCNAGALATAGYGTALGVIRRGWHSGQITQVFATETRPWLQGARLTAWELLQDGIAVTLIADSAAAWLMQQGRVQWVIVGADRIAANGDTANKIGTYSLATLAHAHGVKFMVAAPLSTIDRATPSGAEIAIEHRDAAELTHVAGQPVAATGVAALNPVFDVTPAHLIDALATEKGVLLRPDAAGIRSLFAT